MAFFSIKFFIIFFFILIFFTGEYGYQYIQSKNVFLSGVNEELHSATKNRARVHIETVRLQEAHQLLEIKKRELRQKLDGLISTSSLLPSSSPSSFDNLLLSIFSLFPPSLTTSPSFISSILSSTATSPSSSPASSPLSSLLLDTLLQANVETSQQCGHVSSRLYPLSKSLFSNSNSSSSLSSPSSSSSASSFSSPPTPSPSSPLSVFHNRIRVKVFLGIFSRSSNVERRDLIRRTVLREKRWSMDEDPDIQIKFVIADEDMFRNQTLLKLVQRERSFHKDMFLFDDMERTYIDEGLVAGERLHRFLRLVHQTYDVDYVMKGDDAAYIRLKQLINSFENMPKRWLYWGHFISGQRVITDPSHPLSDPTYLSVNDRYPAYATAAGFAISKDILNFIVLSMIEMRIWAYDDASLGTWLSPLEISYVDVSASYIWRSTGCMGCVCSELELAIVHPINSNTVFESLHEASLEGNMCSLDIFKKRHSLVAGAAGAGGGTGGEGLIVNVAGAAGAAGGVVGGKDGERTNTALVLFIAVGIFIFCITIFTLLIAKVLQARALEEEEEGAVEEI